MLPYRLHISNSVEHHFLNPDNILYIKSNGNYCNVCLTDGTEIVNIPKQLGQIARIISNTLPTNLYGTLVQVGRYYIVNTNHIQTIHLTKKLIVFDAKSVPEGRSITISPSSESLSNLCDLLSDHHPTSTHFNSYVNEIEEGEEDSLICVEDDILILGPK